MRRAAAFETAAVAALLLTVTGYLPAGLNAQSRTTSPGIPNLSGTWEAGLIGRPRPARAGEAARGGRGRGEGSERDLVNAINARAKAIIAAFDEYAAPKYDCVAATAPRIVTDMYKFRIRQQPDRVLLEYEKDDVVRTVWLEGHRHPKPTSGEYFLQGYSTGRYEGNQLVVETTKFTYDPTGLTDSSPFIPSSTRKKVTERYWREGNVLKAIVVTEDPLILTRPVQFNHQWEVSDPEFLTYDCNIDTSHELLQFIPNKYAQ